jgi:putative transposase
VDYLQSSFSVSERRACRVVQQHRTSQRHLPEKADEDMALSQRMVELSRENPRYGYLRVWALLRREGWAVNKKRAQRLWREAGLKVPQRQHKRRRLLGSSERTASQRIAMKLDADAS